MRSSQWGHESASQPRTSRQPGPAHPRDALQRRHGNRRTQQIIQAKLNVGPVDDPFEREADRIASLAAEPTACAEPETIHRVHGSTGSPADPAVADAVARARGGGQAVPAAVRQPVEQVSGMDFSTVRLHVDAEADRLNDELGARAFTVGSDVFVRRSEYRPGSARGDALLRHELAHTAQQGAAQPGLSAAPALASLTPTAQRVPGGGMGRGGLTEKETAEAEGAEWRTKKFLGQFSAQSNELARAQRFIDNQFVPIVIPSGTWVYHGTDEASADNIIHNGIRPLAQINVGYGATPILGLGFYTSKSRDGAKTYVQTRWMTGHVLAFRTTRKMYGLVAPGAFINNCTNNAYAGYELVTPVIGSSQDPDELKFHDAGQDLRFERVWWGYQNGPEWIWNGYDTWAGMKGEMETIAGSLI
jgi:hypothetical protein